METAILALALLVLAAALVVIGVAGITERLPPNRWLGVRMPAVLASDDGWRAGHRAAGPMLIAAAGPQILLAVALLVRPPDQLVDWLVFLIAVGLISGGMIALATRQAERAAEAIGQDHS